MDSIAGFILAGGASSRMGTDKAQLMLDGCSFVERIASALTVIFSSVIVVGQKAQGRQLDLPSVPDLYENWGALGGVHAALLACRSEWAAVVACDLPFVTSKLFARLAGLRERFEAVAPVQSDGIPQPLCSLYHVGSCLPRADLLIQSGERKPIALLQSVRTRWVAAAELADLEGADHFFDNINTPQDYARAARKEKNLGC
jgi:molybdopterin-guanine dinucleotide biosynthesis protein A